MGSDRNAGTLLVGILIDGGQSKIWADSAFSPAGLAIRLGGSPTHPSARLSSAPPAPWQFGFGINAVGAQALGSHRSGHSRLRFAQADRVAPTLRRAFIMAIWTSWRGWALRSVSVRNPAGAAESSIACAGTTPEVR